MDAQEWSMLNTRFRCCALKLQIADVVAQRDVLKQAIESGRQAASEGLRKLALLNEKLSKLDAAFKQGWDATRE